jgi:hypothetical protein
MKSPKTPLVKRPFPSPSPLPPTLSAGSNGRLALAWLQEGQWDAASQQTIWQPPQSVAAATAAPAVALAADRRLYLAWAAAEAILISQCHDGVCTSPTPIAPATQCARPARTTIHPPWP